MSFTILTLAVEVRHRQGPFRDAMQHKPVKAGVVHTTSVHNQRNI